MVSPITIGQRGGSLLVGMLRVVGGGKLLPHPAMNAAATDQASQPDQKGEHRYRSASSKRWATLHRSQRDPHLLRGPPVIGMDEYVPAIGHLPPGVYHGHLGSTQGEWRSRSAKSQDGWLRLAAANQITRDSATVFQKPASGRMRSSIQTPRARGQHTTRRSRSTFGSCLSTGHEQNAATHCWRRCVPSQSP